MTSSNWATGARNPVTGKYETLFVAPYKLARDDQINWWHADDAVILTRKHSQVEILNTNQVYIKAFIRDGRLYTAVSIQKP